MSSYKDFQAANMSPTTESPLPKTPPMSSPLSENEENPYPSPVSPQYLKKYIDGTSDPSHQQGQDPSNVIIQQEQDPSNVVTQQGCDPEQSATAYMDRLLAHNPTDPAIFNVRDEGIFTGRIYVLRGRNKTYSLQLCFSPMGDDSEEDVEDFDTEFCRLDYKVNNVTHSESSPADGRPYHFVQMGRIVEHTQSSLSGIATNFILLLNVSTNPTSLWLAYDYVPEDDEYSAGLNSLDHYHNTLDFPFFNWERDVEMGPCDPNDEDPTPSESDGFLGIETKFDLAMISRDVVSDWKGRAQVGLDIGKVKALVSETARRRGHTLRAKESDPAKAY